MKAVVMAGGEGSRLRPLTLAKPKPLVPVCNKPVMEHILGLLKRHEIKEVVATLHYLGDQIQDYFGDGSGFGVDITYSTEPTPLGTAGSVKKAQHLLKDDTFVIISGDSLTDCDLTSALEFHRSKGALATLVLHRVVRPLDFGIVITDPDGKIERFLEKPGWSEVFSDTVNTGIYILEPEVFDYIDEDVNCDWSQDIFPDLLLSGKPLYGFVMEGYWTDIGAHVQYKEAQEHFLGGQVNLPLDSDQKGVYVHHSASISDMAVLVPPVCIGQNCKIKDHAVVGPFSVIGDNSMVEEGACIERSTLWDGVYIGPNSKIEGAIVGSKVTIKRDSIVHEDAVIGDRCLIDVSCTIRPRIKIWPDKVIERGSTVTMSLIWGNRWQGTLFRDLGVAGLSNIEITPDFATRLGSAFGSVLPPKSKVVTSRDSTRSSRMIKRAIIASLLSVGCDVLDMRSVAVPVARHFIRASGAAGAINVRKLPGNTRVTLIEMFDSRAAYVSRSAQKKIEGAFFREDFIRTDPDDLGVIEFASRAIEEYQNDFLHLLNYKESGKKFRMVCDYGFTALSSFLPTMLARLGIESISMNGFADAKSAPRSPSQINSHIETLRHIVGTLGYEMGALFTNEGERLTIVDNRGNRLSGNTLMAVMSILLSKTVDSPSICMSVTAPSRLEELLRARGVHVVRTKADAPSLIEASLSEGVTFAGDDNGGFIFPELHPSFDAAYSLAKLIEMLNLTGSSLSNVVAEVPEFQVAYEQVACPWEAKGRVMRQISEEQSDGSHFELLDGIKIFTSQGWVLLLPDAVEPLFHVYAESDREAHSAEMVSSFARKIHELSVVG
jgi:mannose-1-phosphate guanylyltransferase/phosphomannomutase